MKKRNWIKVRTETLPAEHKAVFIFVLYPNDVFNVFTAHVFKGVWHVYDPFTNAWRIFRNQQYITHWSLLIDLPKIKKNGEAINGENIIKEDNVVSIQAEEKTEHNET